MSFDFDKILEAGSKAAETAKRTAVDLADKGKKQISLVNEQAKLARAQRQLGALVYSLHVGKEENQPLVEKYIQAIAEIEETIQSLKSQEVEEEASAEFTEIVEEKPEKRVCPECGSEADEDALFCNRCGTQL